MYKSITLHICGDENILGGNIDEKISADQRLYLNFGDVNIIGKRSDLYQAINEIQKELFNESYEEMEEELAEIKNENDELKREIEYLEELLSERRAM